MEFRRDDAQQIAPPHRRAQISEADVLEVLQLVSNDNVNFDDLVETLKTQPALAQMFLRWANSIGLGARLPPRSLRHALVILGLRRIREILFQLLETVEAGPARFAG
jgi:HD-like signal output (HDOD) protein